MVCNGKYLVSKLQFSILTRRRCQDFSAVTGLKINWYVLPILSHPQCSVLKPCLVSRFVCWKPFLPNGNLAKCLFFFLIRISYL